MKEAVAKMREELSVEVAVAVGRAAIEARLKQCDTGCHPGIPPFFGTRLTQLKKT